MNKKQIIFLTATLILMLGQVAAIVMLYIGKIEIATAIVDITAQIIFVSFAGFFLNKLMKKIC